MKEKLKIYIGYDRGQDSPPRYNEITNSPYEVCKKSIEKYNSDIEIVPLKLNELIDNNIYTRPVDPGATTEFTYSRFLVPYLNNYKGKAVFMDSDFLWQCDIEELLEFYNSELSVMCVQHDYVPKQATKMDGIKQFNYPRKNWSSLMLFNCEHPDCKTLTPDIVSTETPQYLHRMNWTSDKLIGKIPLEYNWLEGDYGSSVEPKVIHYTNGGPWYKTWDGDFRTNWTDIYDSI
jgi:lipopolysaccharide biosynthesis glycosyltransferase